MSNFIAFIAAAALTFTSIAYAGSSEPGQVTASIARVEEVGKLRIYRITEMEVTRRDRQWNVPRSANKNKLCRQVLLESEDSAELSSARISYIRGTLGLDDSAEARERTRSNEEAIVEISCLVLFD